MDRRQLLVLATLLLLALLSAGCSQPSPVTGDLLQIPRNSYLGKKFAKAIADNKKSTEAGESDAADGTDDQSKGWNPDPWTRVRFDGVYPDNWPKNFKMPPDTFFVHKSLTEKPTRNDMPMFHNMRLYQERGMAKGSYPQIIEFFRNQFKTAGLTTVKVSELAPQASKVAELSNPGETRLDYVKGPPNGQQVMIMVEHLSDMGGYTSFLITVVNGDVDLSLAPQQ